MHRSAAHNWEEPELLPDLPQNIELVSGFTVGEAARIAIEQIAAAYEKGGVSGLSEVGAASG
jgi:hypothetical protein